MTDLERLFHAQSADLWKNGDGFPVCVFCRQWGESGVMDDRMQPPLMLTDVNLDTVISASRWLPPLMISVTLSLSLSVIVTFSRGIGGSAAREVDRARVGRKVTVLPPLDTRLGLGVEGDSRLAIKVVVACVGHPSVSTRGTAATMCTSTRA